MAPKGKNRQTKTPFYYFLKEFQQSRGQAVANLSIDEVTELAGTMWVHMNTSEKRRYEDMARNSRAGGEKFTSLGVPISLQEKNEQDKKNMQIAIKEEIISIVQTLASQSDAQLLDYLFFFLHFNCYVRTDKGYVVPAEVALCEFSLRDGVLRHYSELLHIRDIPSGYSCTARDISEKSHKIPLPPKCEQANKNASDILLKMYRFLNGLSADAEIPKFDTGMVLPMMFTSSRELEIVKQCMGALIAETNLRELTVKIYPLEQLFHQLQLTSCQRVGDTSLPTLALTEMVMEQDVYSYTSDIACEFHEAADERPNCSRSKVIRWGYTIADYCCAPLGIKMIDLLHCPRNTMRKDSNTGQSLEEVQYLHRSRRDNIQELPLQMAGRGRGKASSSAVRAPGASNVSQSPPICVASKPKYFQDDDEWQIAPSNDMKETRCSPTFSSSSHFQDYKEPHSSNYYVGPRSAPPLASAASEYGKPCAPRSAFPDTAAAGRYYKDPLPSQSAPPVSYLEESRSPSPTASYKRPALPSGYTEASQTSPLNFFEEPRAPRSLIPSDYVEDPHISCDFTSNKTSWNQMGASIPAADLYPGIDYKNPRQSVPQNSQIIKTSISAPSWTMSNEKKASEVNLNAWSKSPKVGNSTLNSNFAQGGGAIPKVYHDDKEDYEVRTINAKSNVQMQACSDLELRNRREALEKAHAYTPSLRLPRTEVLKSAQERARMDQPTPSFSQRIEDAVSRCETPSSVDMSISGFSDKDFPPLPRKPRSMGPSAQAWHDQHFGVGQDNCPLFAPSPSPYDQGGSLGGVGRGAPIKQEGDAEHMLGGRLADNFYKLSI